MRTVSWIVCPIFALAGCLHDSLVPCGNLVCPSAAVCVAPGQCVGKDALAACDNVADATPCSTALFPQGVCRAQVCVGAGCGNGVLEPNEACDDGNHAPGDGCAADCQAISRCPAPGFVPVLSVEIQQLRAQECNNFTSDSSGMRQIAYCYGTEAGVADVSTGSVVPIDELRSTTTVAYGGPRLVPEGDEILSTAFVAPPGQTTVIRSRLGGDGRWSAPAIISPTTDLVGRASRGPNRHFFIRRGTDLIEAMEDDAGGVSDVRLYPPADFGVDNIGPPNMTADGLRIVFAGTAPGQKGFFYSDRGSIDQTFGPAHLIFGFLPSDDPFLSDDCERLYFSAFDSILYFRQVDQIPGT